MKTFQQFQEEQRCSNLPQLIKKVINIKREMVLHHGE